MSELHKRIASSVALLTLGLMGYFILNWVGVYWRELSVFGILTLILARLGYEWSFLVPTKDSSKKFLFLRFLLPVIVSGVYVLFVLISDHILFMGFYYGTTENLFLPTIIAILSSIVLLHVISSFFRHFCYGYTDSPWLVALAGIGYICLGGIGFHFFWQGAGFEATALVIAFVIVADSAAYFGGKRWGKRKLCPSISPGKTWAGAFSALVAVSIAYVLSIAFISDATPYLVIAFLIVVFSMIGDLYISLLKRRSGLKDVASLIPGHGGLLDRLDGHLMVFCFIVTYSWYIFS